MDAKRYLESKKLIGSNKYLQEAFGDDSDDPDFVEYVAWEYNDYNGGAKINFEKLLNANINYSKFVKENRESIEIGRSIAKELGLE